MKKILTLMISLALVLALAACTAALPNVEANTPEGEAAQPEQGGESAQAPDPTIAQEPGEAEAAGGQDYAEFNESTELVMDLDGDGEDETLSVFVVPEQDYSLEKRTVTVTEKSGESVNATLDIAGFFQGFAATVDGKVILLASGDVESCDYLTWMLRYENGKLTFAPPYYEDEDDGDSIPAAAAGSVTDIKNGVATIENTVDLLGSWGGKTQYAITAEPLALTRVPGSVWTRDASWFDAEYWSYCTLKTVRELPVTFDGNNAPSVLESGVKIGITESDYQTYAKFVTEDGRTGSIAVERDTENWGWKINGIHETEYFESVPYAG